MKRPALAALLLITAGLALAWPTALHDAAQRVFVSEPATVLFVGDIMLDRAVAVHARVAGDDALFAGVAELLAGYDAVVGNLEGTITGNASLSQQDPSVLRFTFDERFARLLKRIGVTAVSLANNHALDFYDAGYRQTVSHLDAAGILHFGTPLNSEDLSAAISLKGKSICLVGYHELFRPDPAGVFAEIGRIRPACDRVVLFAHWGEEYEHSPTVRQQELAHAFVDAGADAVIGAHPHVVEPLEIYKNKAIFYSLGNFIFDQGWRPEVRRGLAVGIGFGESKTSFTLTAIDAYQEAAAAGATTTRAVLADVITPGLPAGIQDSIRAAGSFELAE